jgi:hypothetical protein
MATIYSFGPFQLDDESEILFRGKEPTTVGQRAVAPGQPTSDVELDPQCDPVDA